MELQLRDCQKLWNRSTHLHIKANTVFNWVLLLRFMWSIIVSISLSGLHKHAVFPNHCDRQTETERQLVIFAGVPPLNIHFTSWQAINQIWPPEPCDETPQMDSCYHGNPGSATPNQSQKTMICTQESERCGFLRRRSPVCLLRRLTAHQ